MGTINESFSQWVVLGLHKNLGITVDSSKVVGKSVTLILYCGYGLLDVFSENNKCVYKMIH